MDTSGKNRYELLFMDDDGGAAPAVAVAAAAVADTTTTAKKKQPKTAESGGAAGAKKTQGTSGGAKKPNVSGPEKENKSAVLNKNEIGKNNGVGGAANKTKPVGAVGGNRTRPNGAIAADGGGRNVNFRSSQNNENRPRRNFRDGAGDGLNNEGRSFNNEGRGFNNERRGFNNEGRNDFSGEQQRAPRQFRDRDNRGPPRNREGGNFRSGKREFDRQSGSDKTGIKAIDKRDGAGAHNWGSVKQEIDDVNKTNNEDVDATLTDKEESGNDQSAEQVPVPEEEEIKELTLDEWKALQVRNKPQYNIRKAGEGEDTTQWKKMVVLNKKKDGDSEEELEYDPSLYPQRVGRLQRIVDIEFNFNDGRRGGPGRFGRGGPGRGPPRAGGAENKGRFGDGERPPRGERDSDRPPRGGERPGDGNRANAGRPRNFGDRPARGGQASLKVDDERQFPTLS